MAGGRTLTLYKAAIEELGLKQLDVYRTQVKEGKEGGSEASKTIDIIRIFDPATNKVILVKLPAIREAVDPKQYIEIILNSLKENGIPYPERKAAQLLQLFSKLSENK